MKCQFCGAKIGFFRSLKDRQYCSAEHRTKALTKSARHSREASWIYGDEDLYPVYDVVAEGNERKEREKFAKVQAGMALVLAVILVFVLAYSWLSGQSGGGTVVMEGPSLVGELPRSTGAKAMGDLFDGIKGVLPSGPPLRLREEFQGGLDNWVGAPLSVAVARGASLRDFGWSLEGGAVRPGRLRIWRPSVDLADYKVEFEGVIERTAMSWTYRSINLDNYYANKLVVRRPGPIPTLEIQRFMMNDGKIDSRVRLPLPLNLPTDRSVFRVEMRVKGTQFTTLLNGQVIDTWSDPRLKKGGVGFFSEPGERAAIHWVNVNEERDTLLGRVFSLGFFIGPAVQLGPAF